MRRRKAPSWPVMVRSATSYSPFAAALPWSVTSSVRDDGPTTSASFGGSFVVQRMRFAEHTKRVRGGRAGQWSGSARMPRPPAGGRRPPVAHGSRWWCATRAQLRSRDHADRDEQAAVAEVGREAPARYETVRRDIRPIEHGRGWCWLRPFDRPQVALGPQRQRRDRGHNGQRRGR